MSQIRIIKNYTQDNIYINDIGILFPSAVEVKLHNMLPLKSIGSSTGLTVHLANGSLRMKIVDVHNDDKYLTPAQAINQLKLDSITDLSLSGKMYRPWASFRDFINAKGKQFLYDDFGEFYAVWTPNYHAFTYVLKGTDEATEFEENYKSFSDKIILVKKDLTKVFPTTCPEDYHVQFSGCGDSVGSEYPRDIDGTEMAFDMKAGAEGFVHKDLVFCDTVDIQDGKIFYVDAPWGAFAQITIEMPLFGTVRRFGRRLKVYTTCTSGDHLPNDAPAPLPPGLIVRVSVYNPPGVEKDWKLWGWVRILRKYTTAVEELYGI